MLTGRSTLFVFIPPLWADILHAVLPHFFPFGLYFAHHSALELDIPSLCYPFVSRQVDWPDSTPLDPQKTLSFAAETRIQDKDTRATSKVELLRSHTLPLDLEARNTVYVPF